MTDREKLIELLGGVQDQARKTIGYGTFCFGNEKVADHLIANGVTVQEWIPVTERLPERDVLVLCIGAKGGMFIGNPRCVYGNEDTAYTYVPNSRGGRQTKYWMPLPEPPKGEEE